MNRQAHGKRLLNDPSGTEGLVIRVGRQDQNAILRSKHL